jgi:hypothetical protein
MVQRVVGHICLPNGSNKPLRHERVIWGYWDAIYLQHCAPPGSTERSCGELIKCYIPHSISP